MPELPEVETVVRALRPYVVDRRIEGVSASGLRLRHEVVLHRDSSLIGSRIASVRRRAKYVLLDVGEGRAIMFHLGMSGSFRVEAKDDEWIKHDHVVIDLDNGASVRFNDPRRFGMARVVNLGDDGNPIDLAHLGPEPLTEAFSLPYLVETCRGKTKPIKNLVMDNSAVVGVGNIYASESLFRAGIRPTAKAGAIGRKRLGRLVEAIRTVLKDAIEDGGSTIKSFGGVNGSEGKFQQRLDVYGKDGERCGRCLRGIVRKLVQAGRSSYFCPICQR
jgi:formamidopyrimidine-DNA glycosylase